MRRQHGKISGQRDNNLLRGQALPGRGGWRGHDNKEVLCRRRADNSRAQLFLAVAGPTFGSCPDIAQLGSNIVPAGSAPLRKRQRDPGAGVELPSHSAHLLIRKRVKRGFSYNRPEGFY